MAGFTVKGATVQTTFKTVILGFGNNTGSEVPAENLTALGTSKRLPVRVTIDGYTYTSTVGVMGGRSLVLAAEGGIARSRRPAGGRRCVGPAGTRCGSADCRRPQRADAALTESGSSDTF